ncbi:hypothetical protein EUGRSUZ_G01392 [Eucalyptus grandis]|uniref:Uncharacterized protein n=2 Tax=Eucalyptus grandis TaxID=71139 RepID=A0ACC3K3C5_EUCGR|nr:hypothetical protein EUGRSUZ_G01392 [Eucalyptus grandis]
MIFPYPPILSIVRVLKSCRCLHLKIRTNLFYFLFSLAEEDCIYRQISLEKIPYLLGWHQEKVNAFIQRCIKCDNLEALYRQGLLHSGMKLLKRAAQFGSLRAFYMVGLLLVCEGGKLKKKEGVGLLRKVYSSGRVVECRGKYLNTVRNMWWNNTMIFRE